MFRQFLYDHQIYVVQIISPTFATTADVQEMGVDNRGIHFTLTVNADDLTSATNLLG